MFPKTIIASLFLFGLASSPALSQDAERRVALLIGVASYDGLPRLQNTLRDVALVETTLKSLDFETFTLRDPSSVTLRDTVRLFAREVETADVALVYYAGHGVEFSGQNYLLPVDTNARSRAEVTRDSVSLSELLETVERSRQLRIVILDSCREDPFFDAAEEFPPDVSEATIETASIPPSVLQQPNATLPTTDATTEVRTRGLAGLAEPSPGRGTLVAFAAEAGRVALDGPGINSPFAIALSKAIGEPDLEIGLVFRQTRDHVMELTDNQQVPHTYGSLSGDPYFLAGNRTNLNQLDSFERKAAWSSLDRDQEGQLQALADEGDLRALMGLAYMRLNPNEDRFGPEDAAALLTQAHDLGDPEATYELGRLYETGVGVQQDALRAVALYNQAADAGFADAVNDLGFLTFQGAAGIPRDPDKAIGYFKRAAELRHPEAMYNFAALIDDGIVPDHGPAEAAEFIYQALRSGNSEVLEQMSTRPTMFKVATRRELQRILSENEFYSGTIDAQFGPQTRRGLERAYGIEEK